MSKKGLSVVIESKEEFEKLKDFLGEYLYLGWNPAYRFSFIRNKNRS
jgi:hypothetical protein